jgi:hypothetical protein
MAVKFSKRHYEAIAEVFSREVEDIKARENPFDTEEPTTKENEMYVVKELAQRMCLIISWDNPRFKREKFMTACGLKENDDTQV